MSEFNLRLHNRFSFLRDFVIGVECGKIKSRSYLAMHYTLKLSMGAKQKMMKAKVCSFAGLQQD